MRRGRKIQIGLVLLIAVIVAAIKTSAVERTWTQAQRMERSAYVALAWPVASGLNDLDYIAPVVTKGVPQKGTHAWLIPWRFWTRHGTLWRYTQLHSTGGAPVRTAMAYGYGILILVLLMLFHRPLFLLLLRARRVRPTGAGGSSRWATWRDLRRYRPRRGQARVMLGRLQGAVVALVGELMYLNVLVVAPPGMGKTSGLIIPNLFGEAGDRARSLWRRARRGRSLIITDLKGELAQKTLAALSRTHRCLVLNIYAPVTSVAWNPLAHLTTAAEVREFVECWFQNTGGMSTTDKYFDHSAMLVMQAGILHLKEIHHRAGLAEPTLAHLKAFLLQGVDGPARVTDALLTSPSAAAYEVGSNFLAIAAVNDKIISGVFTDLPNRLSVLQDEEVCAVTGANEIDYKALCDPQQRPTALYIALDPDRGQVLTAVFFQQFFKAMAAEAKRYGGTLPRSVYCYLDEFGNCGTITNLTSAITTLRAAGVGFMLIIQTLAQLVTTYGEKGKTTILAGCATKLCLAGTADEDAEWFSKQADKQTAITANAGESKKLGALRPQHDNLGYTEMATELIKPGEIRTLPRDRMLVLSGNVPPMKLRQRAWYTWRYRDNWWMHVQVAMRLGAPWYWPWTGQPMTSEGPRRATPLVVPSTAHAPRATPALITALDVSPTAVLVSAPTTQATPAAPTAVADNPAVPAVSTAAAKSQVTPTRRSVPPPRPRRPQAAAPSAPSARVSPWDQDDDDGAEADWLSGGQR